MRSGRSQRRGCASTASPQRASVTVASRGPQTTSSRWRNEGSVPKDIGFDLSVATIWRPKMTQNIVFRASAAALVPGDGFKDLFANNDRDNVYYSVLLNAILTF